MPISPDQAQEIAELRSQSATTLRATVPGMEAHLYTAHEVLDHGFIRVIDYMGDDSAICQAARVSYGRGTKSVQNDEGLIRYLMRHWHSTPFEMCEIKLHVKLPVFVARQWIRHRTANVNEYSARYSILDREFYIPAPSTPTPSAKSSPTGSPPPTARSRTTAWAARNCRAKLWTACGGCWRARRSRRRRLGCRRGNGGSLRGLLAGN